MNLSTMSIEFTQLFPVNMQQFRGIFIRLFSRHKKNAHFVQKRNKHQLAENQYIFPQ